MDKTQKQAWYKRFQFLDMFGVPIRFHIHHQPEYSTGISICLSFVIIFGLVSSAFTLLINALNDSKISFLETTALATNEILNLDSTNFTMSVKFLDSQFDQLNSFYSVSFQQVISTSSSTSKVIELGVQECSSSNFAIHSGEVNSDLLKNIFCPKTLSYSLSKDEKAYIRISIQKCQNSTDSSIKCASPEAITDYFAEATNNSPYPVSLYFTNNILDMLSSTPNVRYLKRIDISIPGGDLARQSNFYFYEEIVTAESNVLNKLKKGMKVQNSFRLEERTVEQTLYSQGNSYLQINFKKSEFDKQYLRSFTQLADIVSFLGGLAKALVIIGSAFAIPYNEFYYNLMISNEIYEFESRPKMHYQKTSVSPKRGKVKKHLTLADLEKKKTGVKQPDDDPTTPTANRRQIHRSKVQQYQPFFERLLNGHNRLNYRIREVIKSLFCCFKMKNYKIKRDLYQQATQKLRKDVDVITVLKKLQDIDKLKQLLLTQNQLELFNYKKPLRIEYLSQFKMLDQIPLIGRRSQRQSSETPKKQSMYLQDRQFDKVDQFEALFEAYKAAKKESNPLDQKLVEMLGPDLLNIFSKLDKEYESDMEIIARRSQIFGRPEASEEENTPRRAKSKFLVTRDEESPPKNVDDMDFKLYSPKELELMISPGRIDISPTSPDIYSVRDDSVPIITNSNYQQSPNTYLPAINLRKSEFVDEIDDASNLPEIPKSVKFSKKKK